MKYLFIFSFLALSCGSSPSSMEITPAKNQSHLYESDPNNCGAEGYACVGGRTCENSVCTPAWLPISTVNAPTARIGANAGTLDGKYVIHGGCTSWEYDSSPEVGGGAYNPQTDTWSSIPNMTYPRFGGLSVSTSSSIITYGGLTACWDGNSSTGPVELLTSLSSTWSIIETDKPGRFSQAMTWVGGSTMFVYGGSRPYESNMNSGWISDVSASTPEFIDATCSIEGAERSSQVFSYIDGNSVIVAGGSNNSGPITQSLKYDLPTGNWSLYDIPSNRTPDINSLFGGQTRYADDGNRLYITGPNSVWIYEKHWRTWVEDQSPMITGYNNEAPVAWIGSELIGYSGLFSTVGGRYQPPAPGLTSTLALDNSVHICQSIISATASSLNATIDNPIDLQITLADPSILSDVGWSVDTGGIFTNGNIGSTDNGTIWGTQFLMFTEPMTLNFTCTAAGTSIIDVYISDDTPDLTVPGCQQPSAEFVITCS